MSRFPFRTTAAALAAAGLALGGATGAATAQIPGADDSGTVVVVSPTPLTVTVDPAGAAATAVTGRITNASSGRMDCHTPGVNDRRYPGQVTEAVIAKAAVDYYAHNVFSPIGGMILPVTGVTLDPVPTGSLADFLPTGSATAFLGGTLGDSLDLRTAQERARLAGHTGDPAVGGNTAFSVPAGGTVSWSAALGYPASGVRTDFDAAAVFFCTDASNGRAYVTAGYETGAPPR